MPGSAASQINMPLAWRLQRVPSGLNATDGRRCPCRLDGLGKLHTRWCRRGCTGQCAHRANADRRRRRRKGSCLSSGRTRGSATSHSRIRRRSAAGQCVPIRAEGHRFHGAAGQGLAEQAGYGMGDIPQNRSWSGCWRVCPSGLNATEFTAPLVAWVWPSRRDAGSAASTAGSCRRPPPLASPSGLNATGIRRQAVGVWPSGRGCADRRHPQQTCRRCRRLPTRPSRLNATSTAAAVALFRVGGRRDARDGGTQPDRRRRRYWPVCAIAAERHRIDADQPFTRLAEQAGMRGSASSHNWTVPSSLPLASVCPPGLNVTEFTAPAPVTRGEDRAVFSVFSRREARSWVGWMR